jgi:hypothetical protein
MVVLQTMVERPISRLTMSVAVALVAVLATGEAHAESNDPLGDLTVAAQKTCTSTASWSNQSCQLGKILDRCHDGDADACLFGAKFNLTQQIHDVPARSVTRALLLRACFIDAVACVPAARVAMSRLMEPDLAASYLRIGCASAASVCKTAAWMFINGTEMPRDMDAGFQFMRTACSRGDRGACAAARELGPDTIGRAAPLRK